MVTCQPTPLQIAIGVLLRDHKILIEELYKYDCDSEKSGSLYVAITLANLNQYYYFFDYLNRQEILHAIMLKFTTSTQLCANLPT